MVIKLNSFDKDSSAHYSETVQANSQVEFNSVLASFDDTVPFSRFYYDNETEEYEDQATLHEWEKSSGIA